ncbi:hypothetical protein AAG570_010146 [Ranatra chinensis]|uniref:Uncharacterized protein n=1 Tax=Ranatra chinensis TaxID=642074 RepID=A0ABD0YLU4_9HEMI
MASKRRNTKLESRKWGCFLSVVQIRGGARTMQTTGRRVASDTISSIVNSAHNRIFALLCAKTFYIASDHQTKCLQYVFYTKINVGGKILTLTKRKAIYTLLVGFLESHAGSIFRGNPHAAFAWTLSVGQSADDVPTGDVHANAGCGSWKKIPTWEAKRRNSLSSLRGLLLRNTQHLEL